MIVNEVREHLEKDIIPFWMSLRDDEYGGYIGFMDFDGTIDRKAVKGCILHARILWFFSNAYLVLGDKRLLDEANHAYDFIVEHCIDREYGGVFWSVNYDGSIADGMKHTYNQAFNVYALASYYEASKNEDALKLAFDIQKIIEQKCTDENGYLEAYKRDFMPEDNDKLSENGVMAERTMNTLLHVMEAYTELYRVSHDEKTADKLRVILDIIRNKIYNPKLCRQEVFFDINYNSLIDLHSYGHDIETSWLLDRTCEILDDRKYTANMRVISSALVKKVYEKAYSNHSLLNECESGVNNTLRIWWVQAEAVVGFMNAYEMELDHKEYVGAARDIWEFIKEKMIEPNSHEWYSQLFEDGTPDASRPMVEPWKCPYHNGRMCLEIIKREIL